MNNPINFNFEASPTNYDEINKIITIDIDNPSNYLTLGSTYTLSATISLDYELDASIKPFNMEIIPQDDPLNFEIPISDDVTLTLNDIDIPGFNAKVIGTIPEGIANSNNSITLRATYTGNNTSSSTNTTIYLDNTTIEKDITDFLKAVLKGKDAYMDMISNDITASLNDLSNFVFDFKIDLTLPLSFEVLNNENLQLLEIKGEDDILGRSPDSNKANLPIDLVIGEQGKLVLHLKYNNQTGLTPGLKIIGRNKSGNILYQKIIEINNGENETFIEFTKTDIDKIINNNPYYIDFIGYIPTNKMQYFKDNGTLKINAWVEVQTDVNTELLQGGE
ncbi:hypothetical protein [Marinitoga lauensis]|uniref:hypothetical protein n=1 Tax=Marinitoga lauensis TaxID=2201189 RepID=UPI00197D1AFF|nr:hypothetical protein [Marinitoga lauensis]